jgi:L-ascorbate metabolism protein UlaG (beta-lactamase superfamily)
VLANGTTVTAAGIQVEAVAAYDIKPGAPEHPKGKSNGYVITLGGKRIYLMGVTECVPEARQMKNVDVAFVPMNIPTGRMTPSDAAACVKAIQPKVVYLYHYDQEYAAKAVNPNARSQGPADGLSVAETLRAFRDALKGESIEFHDGNWYPVLPTAR